MIAINLATCFLAVLGTFLAVFEWTAAKRREFLYLYMTTERPDSEYFHSARHRRRQFAIMLFSFILLTCKEIYANSVLYRPTALMQLDWHPLSSVSPLLLYTELVSVLFLGLAFLMGPRRLYTRLQKWFNYQLIGITVVFALLVMTRQVTDVFPTFYRVYLGVVVIAIIAGTCRGKAESRLPQSLAFALLAVGVFGNTILFHRIATFAALFLFNTLLLQNIMEQYEEVEFDRHRMHRERQVVVSFLETMGNAYSTVFDLPQVLRMIMESSLKATGATSGAIFLKDSSGKLQAKLSRGFFPPMYDNTEPEYRARRTELLQTRTLEQQFNMSEGVIGQVARTGEPMLIMDVRKAGVMSDKVTEFMRNRSMVLVPLTIQDEVLGVMAVLNRETAIAFDEDDQGILQSLADHAAFAIRNAAMVAELAQKERLDRELQIAHQIQQQLLPRECPQLPGFDLAALGEAALEVGGDYYDFFWINDRRLGIVVADVSGKGIPAAMTMAIIRSIFRSQSREERSARDVITATNSVIFPDLRRDMFVTAFYGILDVNARTLAWCRAGHEPVIAVQSEGGLQVIAPSGAALGIADESVFDDIIVEQQIYLAPGDSVLIYTDGITEAMNSSGEEFGIDRLKATMASNGCPDGASIIAKVERAVHSFVGSAPQHDDMTMVLVRAR